MTQAVTVRKPTTPEPFELTKKKAEAACYKAWAVFGEINSFEDLESYFLRGAGLSRYTYRNYRDSFKRLYDFLKGKHPAQVTAADLEAFYDRRLETVDRLTAYLDIRGIKKCFEGMKYAVPGLKSPFDNMPENLQDSERAEAFDNNAMELGEIASELEDIRDRIQEVMER